MEFSQIEERPTWPEELDGPIAKLGNPLAFYHSSPTKAFYRGLLGLGMFIIGIAVNYIYFFVFGFNIIPEKFTLLLLFGTPVVGLMLIRSAIRDRGMWVLYYPMGLLSWHRKEVTTFPWEEIVSVTFRLHNCERHQINWSENREIESVWIPLEGASRRLLGSQILLNRVDQTTEYLPSSLDGFVDLGRIIQQKTFEFLWPQYKEWFQTQQFIEFGLIGVDWRGLYRGKDFLDWNDFQETKIVNGKLIIKKIGKWRNWCDISLESVPNLHLLFGLIELSTRSLLLTRLLLSEIQDREEIDP